MPPELQVNYSILRLPEVYHVYKYKLISINACYCCTFYTCSYFQASVLELEPTVLATLPFLLKFSSITSCSYFQASVLQLEHTLLSTSYVSFI